MNTKEKQIEKKRVTITANKEQEEYEQQKRMIDRKYNRIELILIIIMTIIGTVVLTYLGLNLKTLNHQQVCILVLMGGFPAAIAFQRLTNLWKYL